MLHQARQPRAQRCLHDNGRSCSINKELEKLNESVGHSLKVPFQEGRRERCKDEQCSWGAAPALLLTPSPLEHLAPCAGVKSAGHEVAQ